MRVFKSWRWLLRKRHVTCNFKMKPLMGFVCTVMLFVVYKTTNYQYLQTELDTKLHPLYASREVDEAWRSLIRLPRGIVQSTSDLELKPLWTTNKSKANVPSPCYLLAIPVGINQKDNVDDIVQKFRPVNFTIILFHYDGKVDGWMNLEWSNKAIHIVGQNQTKWWFAKRFLHPSVVSVYDYIFLWDEDLGVEHFDPKSYLDIVKFQGFEISQPALDPNSTGIHHRITVRSRRKQFHRRVYDKRGKTKCSGDSEGPPCSGFVEGMAPVFSRSAWLCTWHLIQNDLVHGWGLDMKLGYCAQGDRTRNIGVVDSEYLVHQSIQTLGGPSAEKGPKTEELLKRHTVDVRSEIRRQSTTELQKFKARWEKAVEEDKNWVDPFKRSRRPRPPKKRQDTVQPA
ncbi:uncharacterized protein LOC108204544 isoform X2 [Daucus carota subsp. sativus]|uniref:uncharacterized protein LOC108204544 isoform X2 n=1 Tax=Daucus carota subsp. sativus TaxID=79200 RepID=UPI0007EF9E34|nr:PREDICTED: uncharacterized protein LOC108204544 isoform X2 [Daucus carota subsp. sativus]